VIFAAGKIFLVAEDTQAALWHGEIFGRVVAAQFPFEPPGKVRSLRE
jgi:hypothetical protein